MAGVPKNNILVPEDNSIVARKLAVDSVITDKIKDKNVTAEKLADGAVTGSILADGSVTDIKLAPGSVAKSLLWRDVANGLTQGANRAIEHHFWNPFLVDVKLVFFQVKMEVINVNGNFTLTLENLVTSNTMLSASPFDVKNTVAAGVPYDVPLTGVLADLTLGPGEEAVLTFTSDSLTFDGEGIYYEGVWEPV